MGVRYLYKVKLGSANTLYTKKKKMWFSGRREKETHIALCRLHSIGCGEIRLNLKARETTLLQNEWSMSTGISVLTDSNTEYLIWYDTLHIPELFKFCYLNDMEAPIPLFYRMSRVQVLVCQYSLIPTPST